MLAENSVLQFDAKDRQWHLPAQPKELTREQRRLVAAYLVDSRRDLADDLVRRGSPIRRILDDLEIPELERETLEAALSDLGIEVVVKSRSLAAVQTEMDVLSDFVGSVGTAHISPLPARLEELGRLVDIGFDTGSGDLPIRLHGAGARSLAALQTQGVLYARRLGKDGPALQPRPVSLIEEPEAHLHPQAQFDLARLLAGMTGQVVVSTHSSHLVSAVEPSAIRMLFPEESQVRVVDLRPAADDEVATHRARRPSLHLEEMERLRRLVERPFGELLFSSAVVLGDGSTERALLPPLLAHRLGHRAHGVTCVDPGSMGGQLAVAVVKFCELVRIPWFLFADSDEAGRTDANRIIGEHGGGDMNHVVWVGEEAGAATEKMFLEFDEGLTRRACTTLGVVADAPLLSFMKKKKGAIGRVLAETLMEEYPWPVGSTEDSPWPEPIVELISKLETALWEKEGADDRDPA